MEAKKYDLNKHNNGYKSQNFTRMAGLISWPLINIAFSYDVTEAIFIWRRPYWYTKPILRELNSIFKQTFSFVSVNQYDRWLHQWKRSINQIS